METRTIGKFITALRKANGMTQKELAEKLNVSDKTVSRWERDESAPDLSLIPVIAEIFGITCDELLRGERRSAAERSADPEESAPSPKAEKQRQRILNTSLSRYRTGSFIAMGISAAGLIAAMICNLGFLRAYIGFLVGCIFFVASFVCQAIFLNTAFLSVSGESLAGEDTDRFRLSAVRLAKRSAGLTLVLLAGCLPLVVYPGDAYFGLSAESWLGTGLLFAAGGLLVWGILCYFLNPWLLKKGVCTLPEKEAIAFWLNHRLQRSCAAALLALLALTGLLQIAVNARWSAWDLAERITFSDYESFTAFMAQEGTQDPYVQDFMMTEPVAAPNQAVTYYDEYGNEISEEEFFRTELCLSDGTPEGKVVLTYVWRNSDVTSVSPSDSEDGLPISVITKDGFRAGQSKNTRLNLLFVPLYLLELLGTTLVYRKKRI